MLHSDSVHQFKDFSTIDWIKDRRRNKARTALIKISHLSVYVHLFESVQPYILIALIGISIGKSMIILNLCSFNRYELILLGIIASQINWISAWLTDIKSGFCSTHWYYSKRLCCLKGIETCLTWNDWSFAIFNVSNVYIIRWISYTFISV